MPIRQVDPQEDRLSKLAAIAQIYGHLSGPQFQQDELARQQDQQHQALMLSLLQQHGLQQYQQQELAQRQAALTQQNTYQQGELADRQQGHTLQEKLRTDAITARQQELSSRDDNMLYESAMRSGDPKMAQYVNQALLNQQPGQTLRAGIAQQQHQGQVSDAQNAWNTAITQGGYMKMDPATRASTYAAMAQKYPAMNSGEVDFSKGTYPTTNDATSASTLTPLLNPNDPNAFANHPLAPLINAFRSSIGATDLLPTPPPQTAEQMGADLLKKHPEWANKNFMSF